MLACYLSSTEDITKYEVQKEEKVLNFIFSVYDYIFT